MTRDRKCSALCMLLTAHDLSPQNKLKIHFMTLVSCQKIYIGNERKINILHLFNQNRSSFSPVREEIHPSFHHDNFTLFHIGEVSAVFRELLKKELLLIFIIGNQSIVVLNLHHAALWHVVKLGSSPGLFVDKTNDLSR